MLKTIIIELYFKGYSFTEIELKTNYSETSLKRYLADFIQVATLIKQNFSLNQIRHIAHGFDSKTLRKNRLKRWLDQAYEQGALLTQLDLAILLGVCDSVVTQYVGEIQSQGHLLPTRGNIHDVSGAITHKREIITLYLQGYLTPEISLKTNHSKEAVDRYIKDYHRVELLWKHDITDLDKISQLARLSKRVVQQYIDLLPSKLKNSISKNNSSSKAMEVNTNFP